jgi:hypothetical protein
MHAALHTLLLFLAFYAFKLLSSETDLAERSSLKGEAQRFSENPPALHPIGAVQSFPMVEGTKKTQTPKCCLYWYLIEFID